jgi:hypothetical protein
VPWVIQADAYSTEGRLRVDPNPFVEKQTDVDLLSITPLRNQLIIRGAKALSPIMQTAGTALIAESIRRESIPVVHRYERFSYNPKWLQPAGMEPDPKVKYARRGLLSRPEYAQEEKFLRQQRLAQARYVKTPRAAGSALILGGRVIPVMAYGYVGYSLLTGQDIQHQKPTDPWGVTELVEATPDLIQMLKEDQTRVLTFGGQIGGAAIDWAQGAAARAIGFALLQGVFG